MGGAVCLSHSRINAPPSCPTCGPAFVCRQPQAHLGMKRINDALQWLCSLLACPHSTEYAEINLLELLERDGPCDEGRARVFTRQLISAVEHMHEHKVVHRDLKPDNIMLAADGTLRVIDFGLSNLVETVDSLLETQVRQNLSFLPFSPRCSG